MSMWSRLPITYAVAAISIGTPFAPTEASEPNGWYAGLELGATISPSVKLSGRDNDFLDSAACDGYFEGDRNAAGCSERGNGWANDFDGAAGILTGLAMGHRLGDFRIEGEYFYRATAYDDENESSFDSVTDIKAFREAIAASARLGSLSSHSVFINGYYDIPADTKFRPYVGAGLGWARVSLDYSASFTRSVQLEGPLAGSTTVAKETFSDNLFGYQLIGGMDYLLTEQIALGLKLRWVDLDKFKDGGKSWDRLRSHASFDAPGGDPILYDIETDDIRFWSLGVSLKYLF